MDSLQEQKSVRLRQRLWGAAVLIALLVIFLPLLLDGSGSESQYRRVERLRAEPPRVINAQGEPETLIESARRTDRLESSSNGQDEQTRLSWPDDQGDGQDRQDGQNREAQDQQNGQSQQDAQRQDVLGQSDGQSQQDGQGQASGEPDQPLADEPLNQTQMPTDSDAAAASRVNGSAAADSQEMQAWVVQAGSFAEENNALAVRDRLRRAGYPSFVTPTETEPPVYRVRVGPMIDLRQAESSRDKVMDYLGREAIVVSYP